MVNCKESNFRNQGGQMSTTLIDVDVTGTTAEELIELIEGNFGVGYFPFHQCAGVMWVASQSASFTMGWSYFVSPNFNALCVSVEVMRWLELGDGSGNLTHSARASGWHAVSSFIEGTPVFIITPVQD